MSKPRPKASRPAPARASQTPEVVDPRWIIKALVLTLLAAVVCAYLTLCLLFYQGQWQFVLHPSTAVNATPASLGLKFEPVSFAVDEAGKPTLTGWHIPSSQLSPTLLYLHDADTTMSASLPRIKELHDLGFDVFIFDYRGYGASAPMHPTQVRMTEDAENAFTYLRHRVRELDILVDPNAPKWVHGIVPYGVGVGASLATALAANHSEIPAIILENSIGDLLPEVAKDPRTNHLPLSLLFHDRFPLAQPLQALHTPKLLLTNEPTAPLAYKDAASPKRIAEFPVSNQAAYTEALKGFIEEYLQQPVPSAAQPSK